jgi:hypothetical protein
MQWRGLGLVVAILVACLMWADRAQAAPGPRFLVTPAAEGTAVHAWPRGPVVERLDGRTPLGSSTWLWVLDRSGDGTWGRVVLPVRPNGTTGWIRLNPRRLQHTSTWVIGNLGHRRVTLMHGASPVTSWPAAIGSPESPTPTGRFSVTDRVPTGNPDGPFGWYAFGLSGHQPNLPAGWSGGDQLAIHGTSVPSSIGLAASAGCLRVSASALRHLRPRLDLGTPVMIVDRSRDAWRIARHTGTRELTKATPEPAPPLEALPIEPWRSNASIAPAAVLLAS